jgi:hypothetical protein
MFSELADALQKPTHRLALYVAHDASIVRIAAGLGIVPLRWPRLGSEFVFEVRHPPILTADDRIHAIYCRSGVTRTGTNLSGCFMTENS